MNDYAHISVKKGLFYSKQFRFRSRRTTTDALGSCWNSRTNYGSTETFTCVLLDLRKTFGTLNHEILLAKLKKYSVGGVCLEWFESYLKE